MRVFIGPTEIAGYFAELERGFHALGVEVIFADLLRLLGRRILFVFVGSDSRPPYFEPWLRTSATGWTIADLVRETKARKQTVQLAERYADVSIDNPFQGQFHERQYLNWAAIGIPFASPSESELEPPKRSDGRVRILHAPSDPEVKGTVAIRRAIGSLKARGCPIDYVEVTGRPHTEVIAELRRCDFVIDQLYSNTPMAGLATEAAAYGPPTVVGGMPGLILVRWYQRSGYLPSLTAIRGTSR